MSSEIITIRIIEIAVLLLIFYGNALFLVPQLLIKKKYVLYFLGILFIIISVSHIGMAARAKYSQPSFSTEQRAAMRSQFQNKSSEERLSQEQRGRTSPHRAERRYLRPNPGFLSFLVLVTLALSTAYSYAKLHNRREQEIKELEKERLQSELAFLRTQINPHFLFNVFNSMYSLSLQKSDTLPDVILRVSDLLRYMTYESEAQLVPVEKELSYITNYVELQKLRLSPDFIVDFSIEKTYKTAQIAPLILIAFVENAFKHGLMDAKHTHITISISVLEKSIVLYVKNRFSPGQHKDSGAGIGIQNVKRRLEIMYPQKHILDISVVDDYYIVSLSIEHTK